MIPTIILLLLRRYGKTHPASLRQWKIRLTMTLKFILLLALCICAALFAFSHDTQLSYAVYRKGTKVGDVTIVQRLQENKMTISLVSVIKARIVLKFIMESLEETVYENGMIVQSVIHRKLNGNDRVNNRLKAGQHNYEVNMPNHKTTVVHWYPIKYNMLYLFFTEPFNIDKVYSDNFQQFVDVTKLAANQYRVNLPDGNYSRYYYENGICKTIEVYNGIYDVVMTLENKK